MKPRPCECKGDWHAQEESSFCSASLEEKVTNPETLTQTKIIRSLAEALGWLEREISWGVNPADLRALTGRIGELYAAMITRGQMALATNQPGYDVVSADGERISVKTITSSTHVSFRASTFHEVHRVIILRVNVDTEEGISIEELLDKPAHEMRALCSETNGKIRYVLPRQQPSPPEGEAPAGLLVIARTAYKEYEICRYENGAIRILLNGVEQKMNVKGFLRPIAAEIGVPTDLDTGLRINTQQLGWAIIRKLNEIKNLL